MADERPTTRIGVRFALSDDIGALLADARAAEAAGADSLWVDARDADPFVLLAAFAAVTWRSRLVASGAREEAGQARETAGQAQGEAARATCERLSRGRLVTAADLARAGERWTEVPFPKDRDEWRAVRRAAAGSGSAGVVIPNDPRLIDLLRNPDVVDDRSDLNIATG